MYICDMYIWLHVLNLLRVDRAPPGSPRCGRRAGGTATASLAGARPDKLGESLNPKP